MKDVTIYTSRSCGFCVMAKHLLSQRGIKPKEISVDADVAHRLAMVERTGRRTVPQIFIGDHHVGGFDDLAALERSGQLEALLAA